MPQVRVRACLRSIFHYNKMKRLQHPLGQFFGPDFLQTMRGGRGFTQTKWRLWADLQSHIRMICSPLSVVNGWVSRRIHSPLCQETQLWSNPYGRLISPLSPGSKRLDPGVFRFSCEYASYLPRFWALAMLTAMGKMEIQKSARKKY